MKRITTALLLSALVSFAAAAQSRIDTIYVSTIYTTHIVFSTDLVYGDLSNKEDIAAKIIDQNKNIMAVKARHPFYTTSSVSAMESNGTLHTYIVAFDEHPSGLIVDTRKGHPVRGKIDTIRVSTLYTSHIVFATDLVYGDLSNQTDVAAKIIEQNKNMMAVKARQPFGTTASVTAMESNGSLHTFIVAYDEHPSELIVDTRKIQEEPEKVVYNSGSLPSYSLKKGKEITPSAGAGVSNVRLSDAPSLEEVIQYPRSIYHLTAKYQKVRVFVENIFAYSDITYITLRLENESGVSYESSDAMFVIEIKNRSGRKVVTESNLYPKNRYGTLSAPSGGASRCAYTLDKITLSKDQVIRIYVYESGGQRNLELTLSPKDINLARRPGQ